jgi:hypothetical protein
MNKAVNPVPHTPSRRIQRQLYFHIFITLSDFPVNVESIDQVFNIPLHIREDLCSNLATKRIMTNDASTAVLLTSGLFQLANL